MFMRNAPPPPTLGLRKSGQASWWRWQCPAGLGARREGQSTWRGRGECSGSPEPVKARARCAGQSSVEEGETGWAGVKGRQSLRMTENGTHSRV